MTYNVISTVCQNMSRPIVPRILVVSLGALIIWQFAGGIMSISAANHSGVNEQLLTASKTVTDHQPAKQGINAPIFGKYVPGNLGVMDVRKSMLDLKITGIMLAVHEEDSQVIIHSSSGTDQTFRVGDTLPGGAIIKRITADGVFVERKGELESLSFPKNELIFEPQPKPLTEDNVHAF